MSDSPHHFSRQSISAVPSCVPHGLFHRHSPSSVPVTTVPTMRIILVVIISQQIVGSLTHLNLPEGSRCELENETYGVCKLLPHCPPLLRQFQQGIRPSISLRCGFDNFTEIVCCSAVERDRRSRPAAVACQDYRDQIADTGEVEKQVYNGVVAQKNEFPFAVALGYGNTDNENEQRIQYFCGGTLISLKHVLTAAHCVRDKDNRAPVEVRMGDRDLNGTNAVSFPINRIIVHPQYRYSQTYHDVAILELKTEVNITTHIKPLCLQTTSLDDVDEGSSTFVAIGWGIINYESDEPINRLMKTQDLRLVKQKECNEWYKDSRGLRLPDGIVDSLICTQSKNSSVTSDTCQGDSGGPLIMSRPFPHGKTVIGITAFGEICGSKSPGVYTSVYDHLDWIEDKVWPSPDIPQTNLILEKY